MGYNPNSFFNVKTGPVVMLYMLFVALFNNPETLGLLSKDRELNTLDLFGENETFQRALLLAAQTAVAADETITLGDFTVRRVAFGKVVTVKIGDLSYRTCIWREMENISQSCAAANTALYVSPREDLR